MVDRRSNKGSPPPLVMPDGAGVPIPDVWQSDGTFDTKRAETIFEETKNWPPEQRAAMLTSLRAAEVRARVRIKYKHPAQIAAAVNRGYKQTPAITLISKKIETVIRSPRKINLLVTMPPQEGKSSLVSVWSVIRALQLDPNKRIILATYGQELAEMHSRTAREVIGTYGTDVLDKLTGLPVEDRLGLKLARGANKVSAWSVEGGAGGMVAAGIGATITGRPADLFIIDDPFKNMMEADSHAHREKVELWFSSVVLSRLAPDASIIMIQTRWHPEDLAGKVLAGEKLLPENERTWHHVNIPAIAEKGIADALNRKPGTPMISARDTPDAKRDFPTTRKQVGERTWYALYQGSPRNPAGGLFMRAWFKPWLEQIPTYPLKSVVGVDPADSGEGDEAGIIGGMLMADGRVALTHDRSGQYTSDQWARVAVILALEMGATEIAVESYSAATTYVQTVKRAYLAIHNEAIEKHKAGAALTPVEQRAVPYDLPPFMVTKWRGGSKMDAVARSTLIRQAFETGKCRTVIHRLSVFEDQAADWQEGQHQPDRVAAAVIAHDKLSGGGTMHVAGPVNRDPQPPPAWMRRTIGN